ncbi:nose resistant to fluoxetine protein 6-like [Haliotis rubra]|uniref:nose resistant to fluoxetine protein 6-like n=1 Tax=Haliotis rubra TaxID=36100 RepID=UPI001EE506A8|nr:nose resistant to fluoxetine protein 6-like [Haliotis rubra]
MAMDVSLVLPVVLSLITQIQGCDLLKGSQYYLVTPGTSLVNRLSIGATHGVDTVKGGQKCTIRPVQDGPAPGLEERSKAVGWGPYQECQKSDIGRQPDIYHPYMKSLVPPTETNLFKQMHLDRGWYLRYGSLPNTAVRHGATVTEKLRPRQPRRDLQTKLVITLLLGLVTMLVMGTTIDVAIRTRPALSVSMTTYMQRMTWCRVLKCFSVYTNTLKLFDVTVSSDRLGCLNGIRTFSQLWILFSRLHASTLDKVATKGLAVALPLPWRILRPYVRGYLSESSYVMSGLQITLTSLEQKQKGKIDWKKLYLQRYLRATPPAILVLLILTTFLPYFYNGSQDVKFRNCLPWWTYATPIKIHDVPHRDCLPQVLSRRMDLMYALASPLIFQPLILSPTPGLILSVFASASFFLVSELKFRHDSVLHRLLGRRRFGSYIVGVLVGYILFKNKDKIALRKITQIIAWSCALGVIFFHVFGESLTCTALIRDTLGFYYEPVFKVLWTLSFGWIVIACCTGNGGVINQFLSWKVMVPLSKLGYSSFLTRIAVGHVYSARLQDNCHNTWFDTVTSYTWVTFYALSAAFLLHLLCVAPVGNLVVLLWSRGKVSKESRVKDEDDPTAIKSPDHKLTSN